MTSQSYGQKLIRNIYFNMAKTLQEALNTKAGTSKLSKQEALNLLAGTTKLSPQEAWNKLAGTTGLTAQDAANRKIGNFTGKLKTLQECANLL